MPEALPPASTTRRGVDPSKFMGASAAAGKALEKRVANNEKKITILKNILKMRQQSQNIGKTLDGIQESVAAIAETTELQYQHDLDVKEDDRLAAGKDKAKKRENKLESVKSSLAGGAKKALKPVTSFMSTLTKFLTNVLLGAGIIKLLDWFGDKNNEKKIKSIVRFFKDWWPVIVGGIIAFVSPFLLKAGIIFGTIALLAWGVPKIIEAVKGLMDWGKNLIFGQQEKDLNAAIKAEDSDIGKTFAAADQQIKDNDKEGGKKEDQPPAGGDTPPADTKADISKMQPATHADLNEMRNRRAEAQGLKDKEDKEEPLQMFAEGGIVRGPGGIDNVPARLTAGEFVMSKGAVEKWGPDMLAGMNAGGGGTNQPVNFGFNGGGLVDIRPTEVTNVIPTENLIPYEGKEYRKKFQFGGSVTGSGGKDKVPAKLTAGEFVMNRSAVKRFGSNTLAAMNRAGGGTNNPTGNKYFVGGLVRKVRDVFTPGPPVKRQGKIKVIPIPSPGAGGDNLDTVSRGKDVPYFRVSPGGGIAKEQVLGIRR